MLKTVLDFYITSSIHVAFGVYALSWITLLKLNLPYDENVLYFIFFASITGYNFVKFFGLAKFHHRSLTTWLKVVQVLSFFCFLLMGYYFFQLEFKTMIAISVLAIITFLYAVPIVPKRFFLDQKQKLRSIGGLKVYIIAIVWAGVTVILPLVNADYAINATVLFMLLQRFLFVLALMLPFEIRDLKYDDLKLATIPQKIGVRRTKFMGFLLLLSVAVLELFIKPYSEKTMLIVVFVSVISTVFIYFSKINQSRYFSGLFVEAIPIFWLFLTLIF